MAVKILIDSASDLNETQARELGVHMIPIKVQFGDEEYLDGVNLLPTQFFDKLVCEKDLPKTSLINEYQFQEEFEKLTKNGDDVIVITLSSKLSGTFKCAQDASKKFYGKVFVIDSLNACIGERILCEYAISLTKEGFSAKEIAEKLEEAKLKISVIAVIDTLKYLKKGGRISAATAFVGEMLSIKPMIAVIDGEVKVISKARGIKKALLSLNELVEKDGGIDFDMPYGLISSGNDDSNIKLYQTVGEKLWNAHTNKMPIFKMGSTIGTHIGPGAVGIAFFKK